MRLKKNHWALDGSNAVKVDGVTYEKYGTYRLIYWSRMLQYKENIEGIQHMKEKVNNVLGAYSGVVQGIRDKKIMKTEPETRNIQA